MQIGEIAVANWRQRRVHYEGHRGYWPAPGTHRLSLGGIVYSYHPILVEYAPLRALQLLFLFSLSQPFSFFAHLLALLKHAEIYLVELVSLKVEVRLAVRLSAIPLISFGQILEARRCVSSALVELPHCRCDEAR